MTYEPGNQLWKLRSKHGRDALFKTPKLLWEAALEYFQWCEDNPILEDDVRGKDADHVNISRRRPYTIHGLCIYLDCCVNYFRNFKTTKTGKKSDFIAITTRIEQMIYDQKFSGASVGIFNHNIIARDLGLADKKEFDARIDDRRKTLNELFPLLNEIKQAAEEGDQ